ncbi:MAG: hypothetical protein AAB413_01180 [Patescibacteria group bacterium]
MPPSEIWMGSEIERMALVYRGDGTGSFTLGRHRLLADVPVRPASMEGAVTLSRIAARISTESLSIVRTGRSPIKVEFKDGRYEWLANDCPTALQHAEALWLSKRPAVRWGVHCSEASASLWLMEHPLPITHVIPKPGIDFDGWRKRWDANWCARDAQGWHVDELVQAGKISLRAASLIEHVYRE